METILIVDDDPAVREIFTMFLENGGYRVLAAKGGTECIEVLKTSRPDLILLDLMMEPMDGWETLLAIRHNPVTEPIPVLIITGKQPEPSEIAQYGSMIEDFIVKPVDFSTIVLSLHRTIEKDHDLAREVFRRVREHDDPETVYEYIRLLRLVRITRHLNRRFRNRQWADRKVFRAQEERLMELHRKLGFPDRFLQHDTGNNHTVLPIRGEKP
jgi:two-component system OmpR family response regulator